MGSGGTLDQIMIWREVIQGLTLPKTNMFTPENGWLEYSFPFGMAYFQGLC